MAIINIRIALLCTLLGSTALWAQTPKTKRVTQAPFQWESATVYFIVTDRFANGDPNNDKVLDRTANTGKLRGFEGGDLAGIIQKLDDGYFDRLGVNVLWLTPIVEQIHGGVDEGTGFTYGFHGYWTRDWSAIDPNFGTEAQLKSLVQKAHARGIRIMLDAVVNHTGPVTPTDPVFPDSWVRTQPKCTYDAYDHYINCTLVANLPDVKTESEQEVALPDALAQKWKAEGRYEREVAELDAFFTQYQLKRTPRHYIFKWLSDYIAKYGIDGYRVDTAKHTYEDVWADFRQVCDKVFNQAKKAHPERFLPDARFYMIGEVYGYNLANKKWYDFGDKKVDYFAHGFDALINFGFPSAAKGDYETLFSHYSQWLSQDLVGKCVMNYVSSHDDGNPFDKKREHPLEAANKLLLAPGIAQIYYGDETNRSLDIAGTQGDATLRSFMNWDELARQATTQMIAEHWQKLSRFRKQHPAIGAGQHQMLNDLPYVFARRYNNAAYVDQVVVALNVPFGQKNISVQGVFADGTQLHDAYSGQKAQVVQGHVSLDTPYHYVLLEIHQP